MNKIKIAIAGLGDRGYKTYASLIDRFSDKAKLVAIADISREKVEKVSKEYGISKEYCFDSAESLLKEDKLADMLVIATQDRDHVKEAVTALEKGYHILLEKPISPLKEELDIILEKQMETGKKVVVCHVLRYTPIFRKVKEILDSKVLGDIVSINAMENVGWYHQAHSFVRGNWASEEQTSPMILAKCCHDMDLYLWLSGKTAKSVSSSGDLYLFKKEKAPKGATKRCIDSCLVKEECPYNAEMIYFKHRQFGFDTGNRAWPLNILCPIELNKENLYKALEEGPYGRCVYYCDNDVVDHQVLNIEFDDKTTFNFTMSAFTPDTSRYARFLCTKGHLKINMDVRDLSKCYIEINYFDKDINTQIIKMNDLSGDFSGHGGGDSKMVEEFIDYLQDENIESPYMTSLDKSVESHYLALAAEESRKNGGKLIDLEEFKKLI